MILLTGGAGYIGSHIAWALRDAGWPVVVLDDLSTGCRALLPADLPVEVVNCGDRPALAAAFSRWPITSVVHCAGSIAVAQSMAQPADYYRNNVVHALNVAEATLAAGVDRFLFSSTATVYGAPTVEYLSEDAVLAPVNPYAASKAMVERVLTDMAAANGLRVGILRYFNVAGADPAGRSGQISRAPTHLIKLAVQAALDPSLCVPITGIDYDTPDGTGVRDYVHVSDLAAAHLLALDWLAANAGPLVANIGYGKGASVIEVLDALDEVMGSPVRRLPAARRPGDVARLVADNRRAKALLGWSPARDSLADIIGDALAWQARMAADPDKFRIG